ncbi:MAG: tetratricopeptide repeat protein [Bacteroidota bacterium]
MKRAAILCLLLTPFFLPSSFAQFNTGSNSSEAAALFQAAQKEQNPKLIKALCLKALTIDSIFIDARNYLAETYWNLNLTDSALSMYQSSLEKYPRGIRAHEGLARLYQKKGEHQTAILQYQELLQHYPGYPPALYGMAMVYFTQNQFPESIEYSEQAMRLYLAANRPEHAADARMLAGQAYLKHGNANRAIKYFKASKKRFGDKPYFYYHLGECYLMLGKTEKAEELFAQAQSRGYQIPMHLRKKQGSK